jgi:aspartate/methionine/tyrosine aminotransferase
MQHHKGKHSEYMHWAKTRSQSRFNLATSGMIPCTMRDLEVSLDDIEITGPSSYGYEPLQEALATKCGVHTDNVVAAIGTSMANHLAMAALIEPGDEVLIEHPAYEPILAVARYLGADVKRFHRRFENDFRIDIDELQGAISYCTKLIVLTNLHNPSGAFIDQDMLERVGRIAAEAGARVLVDEVYIEAMFEQAPRSSFHLGGRFVATASLTKAYGLSGLRCGWILADPELADRMWRLNDLFGAVPSHSSERLSMVALKKLDKAAVRAKTLIDRNRRLMNQFLDSRDDLEAVRPRFGTVTFPRLKTGSTDRLCSLLREKYETTVVPGAFFEMPDCFRVGIGIETAILEQGLDRLGAALDELKS